MISFCHFPILWELSERKKLQKTFFFIIHIFFENPKLRGVFT